MTDKLREAAQAIVDRWDSPAWGGSAENLRHTGEYIAELRAALAQQDAQAVVQEPCAVVKWQTGGPVVHIIGDVRAGDLLYRAAPTPPAPKPLGWLAREAVECLQGAEMTWMPVWNRQCSSDPVPIFLGPRAVKESLTYQTAPTPPMQEKQS